MKNIIKITLITLTLLLFNSCSNVDFGDTNNNSNGTLNPDLQALFTGAQIRYSTATGRDYLLKPTLYVQYQSQRTYTDEQRYNQSQASWTTYYVQTLSNLNEIITYFDGTSTPDPAVLVKGSANNQKGTAMIFSAIVWKRLTDTWGSVPYEEALNPENFTPAYSDQEFIYKDQIAKLKEARDLLDENETSPSGDLIYGGDILKWKKLANSLILSMSLQLSEKDEAYAEIEFLAALNDSNGVIETVDDEAWHSFANIPGFENPFVPNRRADYGLSKTFTDALQGESASANPTSNHTTDYRLLTFSNKTSISSDGIPYGITTTGYSTNAKLSLNIWKAEAPLPYMTAAYTYLNRAEAAELGWTTENSATMLENGIVISYQSTDAKFNGSQSSNASTYAAARVADAASDMLKVIGEEKWVALFPCGFDAWSEWRRTGYPALVPSTQPLNDGNIPTRYLYPTAEKSSNVGNYNNGVTKLLPATDSNTSKVWWDQ